MTPDEFIAQHDIELIIASEPKVSTKDDDGWEHFAWRVSLMRGNEGLAVPWRAGLGHVMQADKPRRRWDPDRYEYVPNMVPEPPTTADILDSLRLDAECYDEARDFEDFAATFGYDTDSRKAEALYHACAEMAKKLRIFLGNTAYTQLLEEVERL
jgi:hypothetical protein